jgi:aconitate hydratase
MSPEFGCTVTYFPIDERTVEYMRQTNRPAEQTGLVEQYCRENMLWRTGDEEIQYSAVLGLDLSTVEPTLAGPRRPQDKILMRAAKGVFQQHLLAEYSRNYINIDERDLGRWNSEGGNPVLKGSRKGKGDAGPGVAEVASVSVEKGLRSAEITIRNEKFILSDGSVVIAAITSCTNTSNPSVMVGAGLLARKARERGIHTKPWVKTSLAPGSKVVTDYLDSAGLLDDLEALKFHVVGYGCTSCIGNSGPLPSHISKAVDENELVVASVLSGNRNFEARVHPQVKLNYLMSPPLVVAYAIAGRIDIDLVNEPLAWDSNMEPVYLRDIWPGNDEINKVMTSVLSSKDFEKNYGEIFEGDEIWKNMEVPEEDVYQWDENSTYIKEAPFFRDLSGKPEPPADISDARVLLLLGDSITTDHISPAGAFSTKTPAGGTLWKREWKERILILTDPEEATTK